LGLDFWQSIDNERVKQDPLAFFEPAIGAQIPVDVFGLRDKPQAGLGRTRWHVSCLSGFPKGKPSAMGGFGLNQPKSLRRNNPMNKMIAGLFAAALVSAPAFADVGAPAPTAKDLEKAVEKVNYVETAQSGVKLSGYVDAGYTYNFQGDQVFGKSSDSDSTSRGDFNLNAVKLTLEKPLSNANEFQAGFRADLKVGEDAGLLNADAVAGSSDNLSLDQAYVIIRAPLGNGLDITVGKFASLLGYEVDDRPANLNITYGYDYAFVTTHQTGVKFFYPVNDIVELQLAVSNGSGLDTSLVDPGIKDDGYGVTGTINIKNSGGNANWFNGVYYSNAAGDGFNESDRGTILWNTWGNWAPKFANDKLLLGFSSTLGGVSNSGLDVTGLAGPFPFTPVDPNKPITATIDSYSFWTASLYAKYQVTDIFSLAGRASYYHLRSGDINVDNARFGRLLVSTLPQRNFDAWSWTGTAGFDLLENLMLRAEYRIDLYDGLGGDAFPTFSGETAQTVALQAVYTF
jgi:hypothetical protein